MLSIGVTAFKIQRDRLLEARLLEYLNGFAQNAKANKLFDVKQLYKNPMATAICSAIKEQAKSFNVSARWSPCVDKTATLTTKRIIEKIDRD